MKIIIILLSLLVSFAIEAQNCFISEGKEWTVDGMMYGSDDTCIRFTNKHKISQVENVDGKIIAILQAKSWRAATEFEPSEWSGNVVITEYDDKLYIGERLVFDMGLQVGDRFVWSEEQAWENMIVTGIDYREIEGVKRKCIYLCCAEDPNITDIWIEGIGSMIYGIENEPLMKVGASTKMISCIENGIEVYSDEPLDYEYTPLVREGVVWEYFHDGWTSNHEYYSRIYIAGEENINDTIYHKCYIVNRYFKNECIAYLREEDKKVYLLSLDQNVAFQYNTNGQEILIYDFNLNEGDSYSVEIEGHVYDMNVVKVEYENVDGELCKTFEIYNKEINDYYTITEGIGVVGKHDGFFCFPYGPILTGMGNPLYIGQEFYEYTPLVREGAEWGYFIGDTAEDVNFYRLRLSGEEEINGNIYKKCWCYTDCEFSESTAVLCGYLREENKRVYVLYQNAGSEYLLYDFNLQEGDEYGQHPWFNGTVTLPIESVDYVLTTEGLRKRYFVGSNVCYIEGIGIVGTHLGDMLRPNDYPYEENATFNYEKNQGNNVVYQQTDNEIGFTDPCINYGASYEYTPLVREGVVWHYSYYGELYKFSFLGEEEIDGKIYRKCYKFDEKSDITESNGTLIAYLREENRQVYSIFDGSEETMIYDFNLKVGDIYNSLYNQFAITAIDYVSINNCLTKRFKLERENEWIVEGVGVVSEFGHYFFCPFYPTPSGIGMSLPPVLYKQTTIDGQVLVSYTWDSIEKVTQNELLISQAENVVIINGATGKVDEAIYTFDGMKVAEASGSELVSLSTAELPIGIYVVKATDSTGNKLIQKIVIK